MRLIQAAATVFILAAGLFSASGCGVKEYVNCHAICEKKKTCGSDSNYDVSNCTNVCSDSADRDANYSRKVDSCKECVEGLSCTDYKNMLGCYAICPALP